MPYSCTQMATVGVKGLSGGGRLSRSERPVIQAIHVNEAFVLYCNSTPVAPSLGFQRATQSEALKTRRRPNTARLLRTTSTFLVRNFARMFSSPVLTAVFLLISVDRHLTDRQTGRHLHQSRHVHCDTCGSHLVLCKHSTFRIE